jgi:hypothetical protein
MIVKALKASDEGKYWTFNLELQCGKRTVLVGGWRYYPDSGKVACPRRRRGETWVQTSWLGEGAQAEIVAAVKVAMQGFTEDINFEVLGDALDALKASTPQSRAAVLQSLRDSDAATSKLIYWIWGRYEA